MKTAELIRRRIAEIPFGEPFTPTTFVEFGTRATVDQTLSRLTKSGYIKRVARGLYVRPQESRHVGAVTPSPEKVVEAIVKANGERIQMHGAEAARRFGFSTQMPTQPVFLTTGRTKQLQIGNLPVTLKHAPSRVFALANREAGVALSALWYLGKAHVTPEVIAKIRAQLPAEEFEALKNAKGSMPAWMTNALYRYEQRATSG